MDSKNNNSSEGQQLIDAYNSAVADGAVIDDGRCQFLSDHPNFTYPANSLKIPDSDLVLAAPLFIAAAKSSRSI